MQRAKLETNTTTTTTTTTTTITRRLCLRGLSVFPLRMRLLALIVGESGCGVLEDLVLRETASGEKRNGGAFVGWVVGVCVARGEFRLRT